MGRIYGNSFLDANVLDRTGGDQDACVDRILALLKQGAFTLLLPYSVKAEIESQNTPLEVKKRAAPLLYSIRVTLTQPELATHATVRTLIQGNAQPGKHDRDAFHLVESAKNGGRYFITNDQRLLKKAAEIQRVLHALSVVTPCDFLTVYETAP